MNCIYCFLLFLFNSSDDESKGEIGDPGIRKLQDPDKIIKRQKVCRYFELIIIDLFELLKKQKGRQTSIKKNIKNDLDSNFGKSKGWKESFLHKNDVGKLHEFKCILIKNYHRNMTQGQSI